ncbi:MAG TPA: copper-binding protein [Blastocatellia bacterium]|nr:copper-binding protein [Blastocatellia bacterium]
MHKLRISQIILVLTALACLFAACQSGSRSTQSKSPEKRFAVKGKVVAVEKEKKRLSLDHEAIRDASGRTFMDAMTMEFSVRDDSALEKLAPGDQIQATLIYNDTNNLSWLEQITITGAARR